MKVTLIGMGGGHEGDLSLEAREALKAAQLVIGSERLIQALPEYVTKMRFTATSAGGIAEILSANEPDSAAVLYSGDTGFYSGARLLVPILHEKGWETEVLPGLSSVQLLAARLMRPWQGWRLVSAHGAACDPVLEVMQGQPTFFLTGGKVTPLSICRELCLAGLADIAVTVGEDLGGKDEKISYDTAKEITNRTFSPLSVMLIEPVPAMPGRAPGWPDDIFIRGKTPMTKQLVRAAALAKLAVTPGDVCWDVGAGTGSVSVELAAAGGRVYAVERDTDACELVRQNREKFHAYSLTLIEGYAPDALASLPAPDAVFIGGSGGEMAAIIDTVFAKNSAARICVTAIAIETVNKAVAALSAHGIEPQVTQIAVSQSKAAGGLHMMMANNPIFLITGNCQ